jgi:hypothetical protein
MQWVARRNEEHSPAVRPPGPPRCARARLGGRFAKLRLTGSERLVHQQTVTIRGRPPRRSPPVPSCQTQTGRGKKAGNRGNRLGRSRLVGMVAAGGFEPPT